MKFLITGHNGFKGTWLTLLLNQLGHTVYGISLNPRQTSIFQKISMGKFLKKDWNFNLLNKDALFECIKESNPDVVIHLAAQPLVRYSYNNPILTYESNVNGTLNVLDVITKIQVEKTLIITSDKVYKDSKSKLKYSETDELQGLDPYSNSKAMADLLVQSWLENHPKLKIGIARAGNVIGGGDDGYERLVPDLVKSIYGNLPINIRNPQHIRPWQHVLDCLNGYLYAVSKLGVVSNPIWNFGQTEYVNVEGFCDAFLKTWPSESKLSVQRNNAQLKETSTLKLDSKKAMEELRWTQKLSFQETLEWTIEWYKCSDDKKELITLNQINNFLNL